MFKTFPNIKFALLVGIGGGVPRPQASLNSLEDIHLGDVVVGWPGDGKPAVVYWDSGRSKVNGEFEMLGTMDKPPWKLTNALGILCSNHEVGKTGFSGHLSRLKANRKFVHPGLENDKLFKAAYHHVGSYDDGCLPCGSAELVQRKARTEQDKAVFVFHQGRVATGNSVIQDGILRDTVSTDCGGILCIEMEAAGVEINGPLLVIRGIADYADSHKNDFWKYWAAGNAAVFARELLSVIKPEGIESMEKEVKGE